MPNWRLDLMDRYPTLFIVEAHGEKMRTGYPAVEDGWCDVVEKAAIRIAAAITMYPQGECVFTQIKSKFGSIRIYYQSRGLTPEAAAAVNEAIELAEARAECTCELCGAEGRLRDNRGWLVTRCDEHAVGEPIPVTASHERLHVIRTFQSGKWRVTARRFDREHDKFLDAPDYVDGDW